MVKNIYIEANCLNLVPIEAVSSQRSEEIKPKAGNHA